MKGKYLPFVILSCALIAAAAWALETHSVGGYVADRVLGEVGFIYPGRNHPDGLGFKYPIALAIDRNVMPNHIYVADSWNSRVLGWSSVDEFAAHAPADIVIGQPDMSSIGCDYPWDNGAFQPTARNLCGPEALAVDSEGNLYVADGTNSRVLMFPQPFNSGVTAGEAATLVFGQPDFVSHGSGFFSDPAGVATDSKGNLYVADRGNLVIYEYYSPLYVSGLPGSGDTLPDALLRSPHLLPFLDLHQIAVDAVDNLWMTDTFYGAVLRYSTPIFDGQEPDMVLAGADSPVAVAVADSGTIYIADSNFNRVLGFSTVASYAPPDLVFGQSGSFDTHDANHGGVSAASLAYPTGVAVDSSGNLYVADFANHRVLEYFTPYQATAQPGSGDEVADLVAGQENFATCIENHVDALGFQFSPTLQIPRLDPVVLAGGFFWYTGSVTLDHSAFPNRLYVADTANNRILGYRDAHSLTTGAAADLVIGQPDFSSVNTPKSYCADPSAASLCLPASVTVDSQGNVWVADTWNNRVLEFDRPFDSGEASGFQARLVLGQPDMSSFACADGIGGDPPPGPNALCIPISVAVDSHSNAYVADGGTNRVLEYDAPLSADTAADRTFSNFIFLDARDLEIPPMLGGAIAVDAADDLWVGDFGNGRVLRFHAPLSGGTPPPPQVVIKFVDPATPPGSSLIRPTGFGFDHSGNLYVADEFNNRVLEYDNPIAGAGADSIPDRVYGQLDFLGTNDGSSLASASNMLGPNSVALDQQGSLYVADTSNNRVLAFDHPLQPTPVATRTPTPTPTRTPTPTPTATPVAAALSVSPKALNFGKVAMHGTSRQKIVTIKNPKRSNALAVVIQTESIDAPEFSLVNLCARTLAPGEKCRVGVIFRPQSRGQKAASLMIHDNTTASPHRVKLKGIGK